MPNKQAIIAHLVDAQHRPNFWASARSTRQGSASSQARFTAIEARVASTFRQSRNVFHPSRRFVGHHASGGQNSNCDPRYGAGKDVVSHYSETCRSTFLGNIDWPGLNDIEQSEEQHCDYLNDEAFICDER